MVTQSLFGILTGCSSGNNLNDIDTCSPRIDQGQTTHWAQKEPVMTCSHSSSDWFELKPVTQKTGAISLSVFLGQDQGKLRAILKKHLCL